MSEVLQGQIGERAEHLVTNIRHEDGELAAGDVLRRTCQLFGKGACAETCQVMSENYDQDSTVRDIFYDNPKGCSDINLDRALQTAGVNASETIMVSVTGNRVGFGDELDTYEVKENKRGWREVAGYNAFFTRENEARALGSRLADCAHINFEFPDSNGETVIGFQHGTRTNMFGEGEFAFEHQGEKVSYTEYVLGLAIEHYGAEPSAIRIKLASAIKAENFLKNFDSREKMEAHVPGWYDAGYLKNQTNPDWQPGDEITTEDTWEADSRGMTIDDIKRAMQLFGVPAENLDCAGIIDPADTKGVHSSHELGKKYGESRDLYLTYVRSETDKRLDKAQERGADLLRGESVGARMYQKLAEDSPDAAEMIFSTDAGLRGQESIDYWDKIGVGDGGFYDSIREDGCSSCGSHTPGCCDGCA